MNSAAFHAILGETGTDGLWRTNPVLCIDRLLERWDPFDASLAVSSGWLVNLISTLSQQDIRIPPGATNRWVAEGHIPVGTNFALSTELAAPRVIGLAVDGTAERGYVFPLRPTVAENGWTIDSQLPFAPDQVQDGLAGLLAESGVQNSRSVPERLAFRIENPTRLTARGESMTVAAVLSVLDCMGGHACPLLRAAVALIELLPGARLGAVSHIPLKLTAARREFGEPTLVLCMPGAAIDHSAGTVVWEVSSLTELAGRLHGAGLLAPLLDAAGPMSRPEAARVLDRLRWLVMREHRYRDAADLGDRVRRCGFSHPPDPTVWVEFARLHALACRHNGRFADAVAVGQEAHRRVADLGELGSDDEEADAAAEYAASLFSGHRFSEIAPLLQPWAASAAAEPRRFRPLTRVKVWNTLGRALAVLNQDGWDDLFGRSLGLHHQLEDPENIDRTTHYRVHARLRQGNVSGAREALADAPGLSERACFGNTWAAFLHANLARLENRTWANQVLEERLVEGKRPYSAWLYLQATARQAHRVPEDALGRLKQAADLLRHEAGGVDANVCNLFAALLDLNAAARSKEAEQWSAAVVKAREFLSAAPDHRDYYGPKVDTLSSGPDLPTAECLLDRVPYF